MNRRALFLGIVVALATFLLYLYCAHASLSPYRDSGDMAASAWMLGVAHPPGYPLYLLLGRLWTHFFVLGDIAFRLHVMSALAGAGAAGLAAWCVTVADGSDRAMIGGAVAGVLLALSPAVWHLSLVSEMYSLNALVGAALFALLLPRPGRVGDRRLYAGSLLFALGLGNHQTLAAALPGLLKSARFRFTRRRVIIVSAFFLLGFLLYAYLPIRSFTDPVLNWGEPESLRTFFRLITRSDYGGVRLHPDRPAGLFSMAAWVSGLAFSGDLAVGELGWFGSLLAVWGAWRGRRRSEVNGAALAVFLSGPLFIVWANLDPSRPETYAILEPHLVLPMVFAACLAGWGFIDLLNLSVPRLKGAAAPVFAALFAVSHAWTHSEAAAARLNTRWDLGAYDFGRALMNDLPKDALLYDPDDQTAFTLSYFQHAKEERPDIVPLMYFRTRWGYEQLRDRHPELMPTRDIGSGQELASLLISHNIEAGRPLYIDLPQKAPPGVHYSPIGLTYELSAQTSERSMAEHKFQKALAKLKLLRLRRSPHGAGFFSRHVISYHASAMSNLGINAQHLGQLDEAARLYRLALDRDPDLSPSWNNLGNVLLAQKDRVGAEGAYRASLRITPSGRVRYNLARVLFLDGRYDQAEVELRRSIDEGGPIDARNDLGLVFLRTKRPRKAVEQWLDLLKERPDYILGYYNLALGFEQLGELAKARLAIRAYRDNVSDPAEKKAASNMLRRLGTP